MTEHDHEWRHGWIPLTLHAAILKAHGNHDRAEQLLAAARAKRRRRRAARAEFVTPHPAHRAAHAERLRLRAMSDDEIAAAMGQADDDDVVDRLAAELERRDKAERKAAAGRERRELRRRERDDAREAEYDRLVAAGHDAEDAYRRGYGVSEERQRREEAIALLRGAGYRGRNLEQLTRSAYGDHARESYDKAEGATRGHLLSPAGRRAGVDPRSLFTGPDARARKYASEELLTYWQQHGRLTYDDFRASLLGGHMRHRAAAAYA